MGQGVSSLIGNYSVSCGKAYTGKVSVQRVGLYYRITCRCRLPSGTIYRLLVQCEDRQENLGVLVPAGTGFSLETKVPVKRLGEGKPDFRLVPKYEKTGGKFVPVYPEEPFAYISRLKNAYLAEKNGQMGIVLK